MSECTIFTGYRQHGTGYGQRTVNGKRWLAHRYAYTVANGEIPEGLFVCHRCNNKGCVNVEHLYLADNATNIKDAYRDGLAVGSNARKQVCPKCGGPYSTQWNGRRVCIPCKLANDRKNWPARKAKRAAIDAAMKGGTP